MKKPPSPPPRAVPSWVYSALVGAGLAGLTLWAWPPRDEAEPHVSQGNRAFLNREFQPALTQYEAAPGDGLQNVGVHMNRGLARYRLALPPNDASVLPELAPDAATPETWERAQDEMRNTFRGREGVSADDIDAWLRARAAYNLGNSYFSQHDWRHAIDAYKDALRLRPGWRDAAWNLEVARRRKDDDDHPDAGPDAGQDASSPDGGSPDGGSPDGGSPDGGSPDGGSPDGGSPDGGQQGDSGTSQPDGGNNNTPDGGGPEPDAGAPSSADAGPPPSQPDAGALSLAPLDQLERNQQDLQQMILRRRAATAPRNPDDER
ncbi:MAG: tetratricopeptide repeat protein [Myxococcales bacterium]|nr:tetratricopeptide repeat protein [Myxococcales bacterium]